MVSTDVEKDAPSIMEDCQDLKMFSKESESIELV